MAANWHQRASERSVLKNQKEFLMDSIFLFLLRKSFAYDHSVSDPVVEEGLSRLTSFGNLSMYIWPPFYLFGFSWFAYVELATDLLATQLVF